MNPVIPCVARNAAHCTFTTDCWILIRGSSLGMGQTENFRTQGWRCEVHRIQIVLSTVLFLICVTIPTDGIGFDQKNWNGSIVVTIASGDTSTASSGKKSSSSGKGELTCHFSGVGSNAVCSYSSHYIVQGPGGFITTDKNANNVPVDVQVTIANGKLTLGIGRIPVTVDMKSSVIALGSEQDSVTFEDYIVPASKDPDTQIGSWTDSSLPGMTTTIQWSIRSVSQASASAPRKPGKLPDDEPKDASLTLEACSELGVGQQGTATAMGKPAGGTYRFWAEPSSALQVTGQGSTATLRGSEPGRGTLYVQYTAPDGKTRQASKSAASFLLESINGGQPIPEIALFDELGKHLAATLTVPVSVKPEGAGDLVFYKPADPAVFTAMSQGNSLLLQGVHEGKTTLQGATKCGGGTGPVVTVTVVRCSKETLDRMREKEKTVEERLKEGLRKADELVNEKELMESEAEVWKHGVGALAQTAEVVTAGAGLFTHLGKAGEMLEHGLTALNTGMESWESLQRGLDSAMGDAMLSAFSSGYAAAYRLAHAWALYGQDLVRIGVTADQLSDLAANNAKDIRELDDLQKRRKSICDDSGTATPPTTPEPGKQSPPSQRKPPTSAGKTKPPSEHPADQPPSQPPGGEPQTEPPITADPPFSPPSSSTGGFMIPKGCDCSSTNAGQWDNTAPGFKAIGIGLAANANCAQSFQSQVDSYGAELEHVLGTLTTAREAATLSKEQGAPKLQAAFLDLKVSRTKIGQFLDVAKGVSSSVNQCGYTLRMAGEIVNKGLSRK
jgi:hypothetical protein